MRHLGLILLFLIIVSASRSGGAAVFQPKIMSALLGFLPTGSVLTLFVSGQEKPAPIMTWEEYGRLSVRGPYILDLPVRGGRLLYFGSEHTVDPADPQFARLERLWAEVRPTHAFTEGGVSPHEANRDQAIVHHGESGLVRFLADRDGVSVRSLEPPADVEARLLLDRFTREQIKVFYVLRQVVQHRRERNPQALDSYVARFLETLSKVRGLEGAPRSLLEFKASVARLAGDRLPDWRQVPDIWLRPTRTEAFTNDIERRVAELRDEHMVRLLVSEIRQGREVFATVGFSHVIMQEPALRGLLR